MAEAASTVIDPKVVKAEQDKAHKEYFEKLSQEELAKQQEEFADAMFPTPAMEKKRAEDKAKAKKEADEKEEKPAETKTEEKKEEKPAEAEKKPEEKEPEEKPEKKSKKRGMLQEVATAPVEQEAPVIEDETPDPEKPERRQETVQDDDLDEVDLEIIASAEWLAQNEQKFKGRDLPKELKSFWKKEETYSDKWEKANPGEKFNAEAPEHADFYRSKPIDERDLEKAQRGIERQRIKEEVKAEVREEIAPELLDQRRRERVREERPLIDHAAKTAIATLALEAIPEFAELIPDSKNGRTISEETYAKLQTANPVAIEILDEESAILNVQILELETLCRLGDVIAPQRDKQVSVNDRVIMPVADIAQAGLELERRIMAQPKEDREFEGKAFIPRMALQQRVDAIVDGPGTKREKKAKIDALYAKNYTIGAGEIRDFLIAKSVGRVKRLVDKIPKNSSTPASVPSTEKARTTDKPASPTPPSTSSSSDNVDTGIGGRVIKPNFAEEVDKAMGW